MKKEFFKEIEIPGGVEATIENSSLTVRGPEGESKRTFNIHKLEFEKKDNKIIIGNKKASRGIKGYGRNAGRHYYNRNS